MKRLMLIAWFSSKLCWAFPGCSRYNVASRDRCAVCWADAMDRANLGSNLSKNRLLFFFFPYLGRVRWVLRLIGRGADLATCPWMGSCVDFPQGTLDGCLERASSFGFLGASGPRRPVSFTFWRPGGWKSQCPGLVSQSLYMLLCGRSKFSVERLIFSTTL